MATHILYGLIEQRPDHPGFGNPFYVGIGTSKRPYVHFKHARSQRGCRNLLLHAFITDHFAEGIEPAVRVMAEFATREDACAAEKAAIIRYGRIGRDIGGALCNMAAGGQGADPELLKDAGILARISAASRKNWADPAYREVREEALRAAYQRPEVLARVAAATAAALNEPETRAKHLAALNRINAAFTTEERSAAAAKKSPEGVAASVAALVAARANPAIEAKRRANSREPQKNSWADPEIRARRIAAMKGKKKTMTPEAVAARQANARAPRSEEAMAASRAAIERNWADAAFRATRSASQAAAWADPEKRANMLAGRGQKATKQTETSEGERQ